jgi:hypothetical protein
MSFGAVAAVAQQLGDVEADAAGADDGDAACRPRGGLQCMSM